MPSVDIALYPFSTAVVPGINGMEHCSISFSIGKQGGLLVPRRCSRNKWTGFTKRPSCLPIVNEIEQCSIPFIPGSTAVEIGYYSTRLRAYTRSVATI